MLLKVIMYVFMLKIGSLRIILNLDQNDLFFTLFDLKWPSFQNYISGITPGYHMSKHAKNRVPKPSRLAVIEKCHVCDGQTNRQTDKHTDRQIIWSIVYQNKGHSASGKYNNLKFVWLYLQQG